jgi:hypothetical protein
MRLGEEWSNKFAIEINAIHPLMRTSRPQAASKHMFEKYLAMRIDGHNWDKDMTCIYMPDDICKITLTPTKAANVYQQYRQCAQYKPQLMTQLRARSSAEELHAVMRRCKDGAEVQNSKSKIKNHWANLRLPEIYQD